MPARPRRNGSSSLPPIRRPALDGVKDPVVGRLPVHAPQPTGQRHDVGRGAGRADRVVLGEDRLVLDADHGAAQGEKGDGDDGGVAHAFPFSRAAISLIRASPTLKQPRQTGAAWKPTTAQRPPEQFPRPMSTSLSAGMLMRSPSTSAPAP